MRYLKFPQTIESKSLTYTLQVIENEGEVSIEYRNEKDEYLSNYEIIAFLAATQKKQFTIYPITPDSKDYDNIVMFVQRKWVTNSQGQATLLIEDVEELIRLSTGIETDLNLNNV